MYKSMTQTIIHYRFQHVFNQLLTNKIRIAIVCSEKQSEVKI